MSYEIIKYPDGSSYVKVKYPDELQTYVFRVNSYEDLWHLNQLVDALNNLDVVPTIKIPCLFDGQADRRFGISQSAGLRLVLNFLKTMNAKFSFFDPHNPEVVEAILYDKCIIVDNVSYIREVLDFLAYKPDELLLMSADAGGYKKLAKTADYLKWTGETYSASKARFYKNDESKLITVVDRDDFGGKDILIIDDLCIYGGTFKALADELRKRKVGKLYLAVSHMTIQDHVADKTVFDYFDHVFVTNSKYDEYYNTSVRTQSLRIKPRNLTIVKIW